MNIDDDKYLVLKEKTKIYTSFKKRLPKNLSNILGKDFIKKSLETKNIILLEKKEMRYLQSLIYYQKMQPNEVNITKNIVEIIRLHRFKCTGTKKCCI